jgi:hypothetical protein
VFELSAPSASMVLQLRVVLRGISPVIWRRLLVRSDATIADLHATLQEHWQEAVTCYQQSLLIIARP